MTDLEVLEQLGRALIARGHDWQPYLAPLRVLYRHVRDGTTPARDAWSLPHALALAGMLGFGAAWPVHPSRCGRCPRCPPMEHPGRPWENDVLSRATLPDRAGYECQRCGLLWVELHK